MSDLSPWSRKLIASAEGADDPTAEAKRRVRDAVLRSVAMAEPPASPHADPGANAPQVLRGIRHGLAAKVVLPVVVSLGLGAAWLASEHAKQPEGAPTVSTAPMA
ncbi:MAG TPA: hypothetical protein VM580_06350, partial [Labilithrix sp.]|nr:hypothetical protein [Labilithrix sp.]